MSEDITMRGASLDAAADNLVRAARQINTDLDTLEGRLSSMKASWEGSAQTAYVQAKQRWDELMREMITVLEAAANGVGESKAAYQGADRRGEDRFS